MVRGIKLGEIQSMINEKEQCFEYYLLKDKKKFATWDEKKNDYS